MYAKFSKKTPSRFYALEDVLKQAHAPEKLARTLKESFLESFKTTFTISPLSKIEKEHMFYLLQNKYKKDSWNIYHKKEMPVRL